MPILCEPEPLTLTAGETFRRRVKSSARSSRQIDLTESEESPSSLAAVVALEGTELAAADLAHTPIAYMDHPEFHHRRAEAWLESLRPAATNNTTTRTSQQGLGMAFLSAFGQQPLLTPDEERYHFLRMNFLKFQAEQLRLKISRGSTRQAQLRRMSELLEQATEVRNRIIESNVRLVVAVARKLSRSLQQLSELTSEGLLPLMRAVELFDVYRGHRFSTYATWAIRHQLYRTLQRQQRTSERFSLVDGQAWEIPVEVPVDTAAEVANDQSLSAQMPQLLAQLSEREQLIVSARFGLNGEPHGQSLTDISRKIGLSKERVRQIVIQSLEKLRSLSDQLSDGTTSRE